MGRRLKRRRSVTRSLPAFYNRTVFRSRTEARWALFWDQIAIRWEYEPEGFALPDGTWYLPDFWLPDMGCWAEVKSGAGPNAEERRKAVSLVHESGKPLLLLAGAPWPRVFEMLHRVECEGESDVQAHRVCWTEKYAGFRSEDGDVFRPHDGRPRMYYDPADYEPELERGIAQAMARARAAELEEPPPDAYAALGWDGSEAVDGEEWENGSHIEQDDVGGVA